MVLVAEAGATLASIQAAAAKERQQLAIDPPWPERATIGGIVATSDFGPRRARYGAIRDLIIGVTLVRADGVVAKSGGKVVKNVAGFDLPKVACGSLGTLAGIATATFRLHPLPEASATVLVPALGAPEVSALVKKMTAAQLEPVSAVGLRGNDGRYLLGVRFEGFGKGVQQQCLKLRELASGEVLSETAAAAFWSRHDEVRIGGPVRARISSLPSRLPVLDPLLPPAPFAWYATLGIGFLAGDVAGSDIEALRAAALKTGGRRFVLTASRWR